MDLNEAIRLDPDKASYYRHRGAYWLLEGVHGHAIVDFNEAIRLDPKDANSYSLAATLGYTKSNMTGRSWTTTQRSGSTHETAGITAPAAVPFEIRDYDQAIEDYDEAIRLDATHAFFYYGRAKPCAARNATTKRGKTTKKPGG